MLDFLTMEILLLLFGGFFIGIFGVVIGGSMFLSLPLVQWLFPEALFGAIVGNIKMGSFTRGIGTILSTHRHIEYWRNIKLSLVGFVGAVLGASFISGLNQNWILPTIIFAVIFAVYAPKFASKVSEKAFYFITFLLGIYAGFLGAGIGVLIIALLRLKYTKDTEIAHLKIQARFVEWLLVIVTVTTHYMHGNMVAAIWVPWAIGSLAGGYSGGFLLHKMRKFSGSFQKTVLYIAFAVAILIAAYRTFDGF